jgi:hypothetical protein
MCWMCWNENKCLPIQNEPLFLNGNHWQEKGGQLLLMGEKVKG